VDIASLARQLSQELSESSSLLHTQLVGPIIIAEVGSLTRNVDEAEYNPHHVSIGPYHWTKNPELARNEEKIRSLGAVLPAGSAAGTTMEACLDKLACLEGPARSCYAHSFEMNSEKFVRMLLLDACYILVKFGDVPATRRRTNGNGTVASNGYVQGGYHQHGGAVPLASAACGSDQMERVAVLRDVLYLAENQIPFFIVQKISEELTVLDGGISAADRFAEKIRDLLIRRQYLELEETPQLSEPGNLLHLLHMHFKPNVLPLLPSTGERVDRWRTATEYYLAGVKFKCRPLCTKGARCILDVKLNSSSGVLEIPRLHIDAETWRMLRNLMALEQGNPGVTGSNFTAYCVFMSQLACTPMDVELLTRSGVIAHVLGNNSEVASCFTDLCKGVVFSLNDGSCNYLRATCQALDKQFQSRHSRWMAWLWRKYFRNPWLAVGLAAAVVGLVCTVVQAVYSVLSYQQGAR
jgi:hypothetical protein